MGIASSSSGEGANNVYESHPDVLVVATAEEVVAAVAVDAERLAALRRRFVFALHDVGWIDAVGGDWVRIGRGGLEFGALSFKQADLVLCDLEDIGHARTRSGR